MEENDTFMEGH